MASTTDTWYPATGFYFIIEVDGITDAVDHSFKEVSGLKVNVGSEKIKEGGVNNYTHELPTQVESSNLVLKRGMLPKKGKLVKWVEESIFTDYTKPLTLKNIVVKLLNQNGKPLITWTFNDARPVKYEATDFDAGKNEVLVETMEFTYTFYKRLYAN